MYTKKVRNCSVHSLLTLNLAMNTVTTVRDFTMVFDAYSQHEGAIAENLMKGASAEVEM